ncbi:MAG: inorganic phosphate transporter [Bacteroidota bacterium]|nr:inorganic phosphate transporter [Bacteroidota bacterium]
MFGLSIGLTILLIVCLLAACSFEFINGFHDTANAVATVIYTNTLKPDVAVMWSGLCNFVGVNVGGIAVAIGIINLLPVEALVDQNIYHAVSMILALILTSVIWNLGTWYFGIPCSSSHALIGSIFGVGLAFMMLPGSSTVALNWHKAADTGLSLLISPILGFGLAMFLMYLLKLLVKNKALFKAPSEKKHPPLWIRGILVTTCSLVSFSHGSNDGQKGVGLIMIILIGIIPAHFALDRHQDPRNLLSKACAVETVFQKVDSTKLPAASRAAFVKMDKRLDTIKYNLANLKNFDQMPSNKHFMMRKDILLVAKTTENIFLKEGIALPAGITQKDASTLRANVKGMRAFTEYSPWWVILMISTSLGLGTMVGWKRIVVTIGEKIGKTHLTYAQGATAEVVAAATIGASTLFGLPVSTTHVLSSGVAGSMVAGGGMKNLQMKTITNIAIAWLITLPVTTLMSGTLFLIFRLIFV